MPEHLRALIVILGLATVVFAIAKAPACALASTTADFERRRNLWFGITLAAFLAHNFWIYLIIAAALLFLSLPREPNKLAMYFFVLLALPPIEAQITGLGVINHFFTIHYYRLLALAVLLPAFLILWKQPESDGFGRLLPDKLILGYIGLQLFLMMTVSTFTNSLRFGVFYAFIDIFLPYYVASRSLKNLQGFREVLMAFTVAALVLSAIAAFEFTRHWLLYASLDSALGERWVYGHYLERGTGSLRAQGTTGQPIPLGFVMAVAIGLFLYLRKSVADRVQWALGLLLLIPGLVAPVSRGPWLGAGVILLVFVVTGPSPGVRFAKLGLLAIIIVSVLLALPAGDAIIDRLPFVGTAANETVTYRKRLLGISIEVIKQRPFFGAFNYLYSPEMQELKQGQGIIDIVNTYVAIALGSGLVGFSLFSGFFIAVAAGIFDAMTKVPDKYAEEHLLGQVLLSTLLGVLVIIATVSSITIIPVIYWSLAGLGVAYARMLASARAATKRPAAEASQFKSAAVTRRT